MSDKNKSIVVTLICTRCKHKRVLAVEKQNIAKPPKPCPQCGCQEWKQEV